MVQVPNTAEGRTYMIKTVELDPKIVESRDRQYRGRSYTYHDPDEYVVVQVPYVVPNGKWVLEEYLVAYGSHWTWVAGVDNFAELDRVELERGDGWSHSLYINDEPFGLVVADEESVDQSVYPARVLPSGGKTLEYARQIHKGELSHGPRIPRLNYVRQPFAPQQKLGMKARERRRGQHGWVRLADLGEMTVGYNTEAQVELVLGYWQFSCHANWLNGQQISMLVDVALGSSLDIKTGDAEFRSLTPEQFREECSVDTSDVWVRRGFAYTILRLQALGVAPEAMQPA